jgi:hypothetical protein
LIILISFALLRGLLLLVLSLAVLALGLLFRFLLLIEKHIYVLVVEVVVLELLIDSFFDQLLRPSGLDDILSELLRSRVQEELKLFAVADSRGSFVSVSALDLAVRAVVKNEAIHLDRENEDEDGLVDRADPFFVVLEIRSHVLADAYSDSLYVVVHALGEQRVEGEHVRNIESEVVHRVSELVLDVLFCDFYVAHFLVLVERFYIVNIRNSKGNLNPKIKKNLNF